MTKYIVKEHSILYKEVEADSPEEAEEIAEHYKVHKDLIIPFQEWYHDYMRDNPDLFDHTLIYLDSDYIVDWWEADSYLYDNFDTPYMEITK